MYVKSSYLSTRSWYVLYKLLTSSMPFSFFFKCSGDHRVLHVLTHSSPTRRSSDLGAVQRLRAQQRAPASPLQAEPSGRRGGPVRAAARPVGGRERVNVSRRGVDRRPRRRPVAGSGNERRADRGRQGEHHERSEEHTSELQSLMRISYAVFCL